MPSEHIPQHEFVVRISGRNLSVSEMQKAVIAKLAELHDDIETYGPAVVGVSVEVERRV